MATLTLSQFLRFLQRYCQEKHDSSPLTLTIEHAKSEAYGDVGQMVAVYLQDYAEQKKMTKQVEEDFLNTITGDNRRQFDDPVALISHIQEIASKPPFFDSERISLAAIQGFCNDFLHEHEKKTYQEQRKQAPF